ncbi:MAG: dienelactone hydrolase family protein, partial [Acidimicrobiia bacterium]
MLRAGTQETSTESRTLPRGDALVPVFHARPDGMPIAGVVLHPDIMGVRPLFETMATRLASHGFAVAVVEPFARRSEAERAASDVATRMGWVADLDDDEQLDDLAAAADLLVVDDDVTSVGVLGFCLGGLYALEAAATDRFDRAVAFYGMIRRPDAWKANGRRSPLDTAADVCPTLAIFGSIDALTPPDDIAALRTAWAGRDDCEIVVVEGADHGFVHDPDRPAHRPDASEALWNRAIAW